jgi:hypothetical protein
VKPAATLVLALETWQLDRQKTKKQSSEPWSWASRHEAKGRRENVEEIRKEREVGTRVVETAHVPQVWT